ncbi:Methyltransferase-like protein 13 [Smittium mucronatum]|uniref:Methyltransferase-like protein 13 n=1 Tax=Smittium mucronatum TaxID=133383 RepID=A0A1R0GY27_9FUNG|nr:Methyltransferase-like protein 13 [Smittium mucronatum]
MHTTSYDSKDYWVSRFEKEKSFDWLLDYSSLKPFFDRYCTKSSQILNLGCGNSPMPFHLFDDGFGHSLNLDYCENVVENMQQIARVKYSTEQRRQGPFPKWEIADVLDMPHIPCESFDLIFEKSTSDCISTLDNDGSGLRKFESEIYRVCKSGGIWISVSYSQDRWDGFISEKRWAFNVEKVIVPQNISSLPHTSAPVSRPIQYQYIYIFKKNTI